MSCPTASIVPDQCVGNSGRNCWWSCSPESGAWGLYELHDLCIGMLHGLEALLPFRRPAGELGSLLLEIVCLLLARP